MVRGRWRQSSRHWWRWRVAWVWILVGREVGDGLVAPSVVGRARSASWRAAGRQGDGGASTSEWGSFSKRPLRRGLALTRAAFGVARARRRARRLERKDRAAEAEGVRRVAAETLTERLIRLGPTYVKLGQIASNREELEGSVWAEALARLQDDVPPFETGLEAIARELGAPLESAFSSVEAEPIAAASLGQVHRGVLRSTGEAVAIKIQRPGLLSIYETDARLLRRLARLGDLVSRGRRSAGELSWADLCNDSIAVLYRELDYRREAANGERFAACLAEYSDWVRCPAVRRELSTDKMLVMEYVPGISLKRLAALDARGFDRRLLAERLAKAYLLQFCKFGVFNADPHAGNLAADDAGRLVLYDFGQVAELSPDQSRGIYDVIQAIIDQDAAASVRAFDKMGVLKPGADLRAVAAVVQSNFDTGRVRSRACLASKAAQPPRDSRPPPDQAAVMRYFQLPASYAFVARALSQLTGVGQALDPDFEFIAAAAPALPEIAGTQTYLKDLLGKRFRAFTDSLRARLDPPAFFAPPNFDHLFHIDHPPANGADAPLLLNGQPAPRNGRSDPPFPSPQYPPQNHLQPGPRVPAAR
mmetsp:Transcript_19597/g.61619  ORF Transcript_19597/g.61619 Transcript_19597/m.61619 type:complete len:590 (+) Transcript_19597:67-1836(+)